MTQYINEFNEVCYVGHHSTLTRRDATELELQQQEEIKELNKQLDWWKENGVDQKDLDKVREANSKAMEIIKLKNKEIEDLKTERQINYRSPRDLHDRS